MRRIIIIWLPLFLFLMGCSTEMSSPSFEGGESAMEYDQLAFADNKYMKEQAKSETTANNSDEDSKLKDGQPGNNDGKDKTQPKIIREAEIGIRVDDYQAARAEVSKLVKEFEAYIANENERKARYYIENTIIIRMPSKHFDTFVDKVGEIASKVDYKRVKALDVTKQYVDIESRLKTKKETRDKYNQFLKNAKNVEEMLAIEEKVRLLTEEIEAKEAELRYLSDRVSFSTVTLDISQPLEYQYDEPRYAEPGFGQRMGKAFANGWKGVLTFVVGLTNMWPVLLAMGGIFFVIFRVIRSSSSKGGKKKE